MKLRKLRKKLTSIVVVVVMVGVMVLIASLFGIRAHSIGSGSMAPGLQPGAIVITYDVDVSTLKPGDVITFKHHSSVGEVTTHHFMGFNDDGTLQTWGEANTALDNFTPSIYPEDVVGKEWRHTDLLTAQFWQSSRGIMVAVALIVLVVVAWLYDRTPRSSRSNKKYEPAPAESSAR